MAKLEVPGFGQVKVPTLCGLIRGSGAVTSSTLAGLEHAVGLAVGDHGGGVVEEPVEHGDGGGVFGQEPSPVLEGVV
jgi:hypothetical protein